MHPLLKAPNNLRSFFYLSTMIDQSTIVDPATKSLTQLKLLSNNKNTKNTSLAYLLLLYDKE